MRERPTRRALAEAGTWPRSRSCVVARDLDSRFTSVQREVCSVDLSVCVGVEGKKKKSALILPIADDVDDVRGAQYPTIDWRRQELIITGNDAAEERSVWAGCKQAVEGEKESRTGY